jgi:cytochrome c-type biogenesis protein
VALVAGALAAVNPCGVPLLPAFLSFYVGAEEKRLPQAPTRALQGALVGLLVCAGFLAVFVAVGLPVSYGATTVAEALPWTGIAIGVVLILLGLALVAGRSLYLTQRAPLRVRRERRLEAMLLFGVGYGIASLACTLPIFLALVGVSVGPSKLVVFAAYGAGMALMLMALSIGAALMRDGLTRGLRRLLPHMERIAGALLAVAGGYLVYYWARIRFGEAATLADDPIVEPVTRFSAEVQAFADQRGLWLVAALAVAVSLAVVAGLRRKSS